MTARLVTSVVVVDPKSGNTRTVEEGTEATKELREQIPNSAAWSDDDSADTDPEPKAKSGNRRQS